MSGLPSDQILAIIRLRTWAADSSALRSGKTATHNRTGWTPKPSRAHDARLVRMIDFDLAFKHLPQDEQIALLVLYRDRGGMRDAALAVGCSPSKLTYLVPRARQHLADLLGRRGLL